MPPVTGRRRWRWRGAARELEPGSAHRGEEVAVVHVRCAAARSDRGGEATEGRRGEEREGEREARVSWSTEADADRREEAARGGRHTGNNRRGPLAWRHGRRRAPLGPMADAAP